MREVFEFPSSQILTYILKLTQLLSSVEVRRGQKKKTSLS